MPWSTCDVLVMQAVHAVAGDLKPASYFSSKAAGYELHAYPSLSERNIDSAHDPKFLALLPLRKEGDKPPTLAFPELPEKAVKDSDAVPLAYVQAGLRIYEQFAAQLSFPSTERADGPRMSLQAAAEIGLGTELSTQAEERREEGVWLHTARSGAEAIGKFIVS